MSFTGPAAGWWMWEPRQKARFRSVPWWSRPRWPRGNRRSCPSTACPAARRSRLSRSYSERTSPNNSSCCCGLRPSGNMHISPRTRSCGSSATAAANAITSAELDTAPRSDIGQLDLHAHIERRRALGPLGGQSLGDAKSVESVHPGKSLGHDAGLVGLEPADVVPGELQPGERVEFGQRLLQVVLAKILDAQPRQHPHRAGTAALAHRQQRDAVLIPARCRTQRRQSMRALAGNVLQDPLRLVNSAERLTY